MTNSTDFPQPATLQIRSSSLSGTTPGQVQCQVSSSAGKRVTLIAAERVPVSSIVSVEYNDAMLLCEVVACTQDCEQKWHLELNIEQILTSLQSLVLLRERLLGESVPSRKSSPMFAAQRA